MTTTAAAAVAKFTTKNALNQSVQSILLIY